MTNGVSLHYEHIAHIISLWTCFLCMFIAFLWDLWSDVAQKKPNVLTICQMHGLYIVLCFFLVIMIIGC